MGNLKYNPPIPEKVKNESVNNNIIPIVTSYELGDVLFEGYKSSNLSDLDVGGENHIVFDAINEVINRFVVYEKHGSNFVVGWLYKSDNGVEVHIRKDISIIYDKDLFSNEPTDINEKFDAYN